jgi:26S proteasome regulatory subunit N1
MPLLNKGVSLSLILLWDIDVGLTQIDKYFSNNDTHVIAGVFLAIGIVNCVIENECYLAHALLVEYVSKEVGNLLDLSFFQ